MRIDEELLYKLGRQLRDERQPSISLYSFSEAFASSSVVREVIGSKEASFWIMKQKKGFLKFDNPTWFFPAESKRIDSM